MAFPAVAPFLPQVASRVTPPVGRDRQGLHDPSAVPTWYRISGGFIIVFVTQQ